MEAGRTKGLTGARFRWYRVLYAAKFDGDYEKFEGDYEDAAQQITSNVKKW
jgi:hypothetical protein